MAYASLSEAVKSSAFETLSPEAKQVVFDKYSKDDSAYNGLSTEAKQHVQDTYLGKKEAPKPVEKPMYDKATEVAFGEGPAAHMGTLERVKRIGEAGAITAGVGGAVGWLGGPAGAATGAAVGFTAGALGEVYEQATSNLGGGRLLQVVGGLVASAPAEAVSKAIPSMIEHLLPSVARKAKYAYNLLQDPATKAAAEAAILKAGQQKQFGERTPGYTQGQTNVTGDTRGANEIATQERLQKEHKFGEARGYAPSGKYTEEPVTPGTALATGKENLAVPGAPKRAEGYTEKLEPTGIREAKIDPKTGKPENVSKVLRNEMYKEVGNVTVNNPAQRFSSSEQFKALETKMNDYVTDGLISKADKNHLLTILKADQGSIDSQGRYGQTVDRQIRKWAGKPDATGAAALDNEAKNAVRNDLRNSFAEWTDKQGFGSIEKDYRSAFTQEKIAEAKDYIPKLISRFDGKKQTTQFVRQMVNETPETKELIKSEMNKFFANVEPKDIPKEFNRIEKILVDAKLFEAEELNSLRQQVVDVEKGGDPEAIGARMKRILNRYLKVTIPAQAARSAIMGQTTDNKNK